MKFEGSDTPLKTLPFILLALAALALAGCMPLFNKPGQQGTVMSKEDPLPEHQSWCYQTLGAIDCYAHPQNFPPGRLVNVSPQSRYPLTAEEYGKTVSQGQ